MLAEVRAFLIAFPVRNWERETKLGTRNERNENKYFYSLLSVPLWFVIGFFSPIYPNSYINLLFIYIMKKAVGDLIVHNSLMIYLL
ncbi:MAG: hypothetical protein EAZ76_11915 [Nostocales cyanobacterium]|nr:MAG: hypothetical protein EAZ87_17310 [Nostocales cyanobacterium]TAF13362.1 MAG: hypothetical protein EAZ76_11915 [Nostocales cyanobacterium]